MKRNKKIDIILLIILLSYFMILLDNSIVFTGIVKISESLHLTQIELSWITNAYALTFGGFLLFAGKAGDIFGRRRIFQIGLVIFGIGSLLVAIAPNGIFIILSRAFEGIGSAFIAPTSLALIMDNYIGENRTKAIAYYGATAGIGASIGLVIGGLFASLLSWRYGFLINVPISIIMIIFSNKYIHKSTLEKGKLDYIGTLTSLIGIIALVYGIDVSKFRLISLIIAITAIGIFIYRESKVDQPIVPLSLFSNKERMGAYIARLFFMGAMLSFWFLTPELMQNKLHFTALMSGIGFFPLTLINFFIALKVAKLTKRFGNGKLLFVGLLTTLIGLVFMIFFSIKSGYILGIALPMIFIGAGQGMSLSPLTVAGVAHTTAEEAGSASGVVNTVHQVGGQLDFLLSLLFLVCFLIILIILE